MQVTETGVESLPGAVGKFISRHISSDEQVQLCFFVKDSVVLMGQVTGAVLLTDKNLLYCGPLLFNLVNATGLFLQRQDEDVIPLTRIRDIKLSESGCEVRIDHSQPGRWGEPAWLELRFSSREQASRLAREISRQTGTPYPSLASPLSPLPDVGDQLARLAELYNRKLLTPQEFEAAKRKLLSSS